MKWIIQEGVGLHNISNRDIETFRSAIKISLMLSGIYPAV